MLCAPACALGAAVSPAVRRRRRPVPPLRGAVCACPGRCVPGSPSGARRGRVWVRRRSPLASWRGSLGSRCPAGAPGACGGSTCWQAPPSTILWSLSVYSLRTYGVRQHPAFARPVRLQRSTDCVNSGLLGAWWFPLRMMVTKIDSLVALADMPLARDDRGSRCPGRYSYGTGDVSPSAGPARAAGGVCRFRPTHQI